MRRTVLNEASLQLYKFNVESTWSCQSKKNEEESDISIRLFRGNYPIYNQCWVHTFVI